MEKLSPKKIALRNEAAVKLRANWKEMLQDCYELAHPSRNPYNSDTKRPRAMDRMFDSTAMSSNFRAANRMLAELTPSDQVWSEVKVGPLLEIQASKQQVEELEKQLEPVNKMLAMVFRNGSFVASAHESYLDLSTAGLGALLVLEGDDVDPVIFESVPQNEIAIEEGAGGKIVGIYRNYQVKNHVILDKWPQAKIPEELKKLIDKDDDCDIKILETTYMLKDKEGQITWEYQVFWKKEGGDPVELTKRTYQTNPWVVFRWSKIPGSPYGPGPVMLALPDIRTANKMMQMILQNAALAITGMYMVADDGVLNPDNITITQGGLIPVARTGGSLGASIAPLETGRNFNVGQIVLEDLRMQIKKIMFDNALPPLNGSVRSATEFIQRQRELTQDIGGSIGRLTHELIVPLVQRAAAILIRKGLLPDLKIDQYHLKVQVNAPLARVQQLQAVENLTQWLEISKTLGGDEVTALVAKMEESLAWIGDALGVPNELIRTEDERTEQVNKLKQMMQEAAAAEAGQVPAQQAAGSELEIA